MTKRCYSLRDGKNFPARETERGAVFLELAISIVLLVLLTSGVIDWSLSLREHAVMVEAARTGARIASSARGPAGNYVSGADLPLVAVDVVQNCLQDSNLNPEDYIIAVSAQSISYGTGTTPGIRVTITRPGGARFLFLVPTGFQSQVSSVFVVESLQTPASAEVVGANVSGYSGSSSSSSSCSGGDSGKSGGGLSSVTNSV